MDPVWTAILVALTAICASTIAPWILSRSQGKRDSLKADQDAKIRAKEKSEDYARQDEVALRLQAYAQTQVASQKLISDKVDIVHTLVNSSLTSAKQRELNALVALANLTREVLDLRRAQGLADNPKTISGLAEMDRAIIDLKAEMVERARQDDLVKEQLKRQAQSQEATPLQTPVTPAVPASPSSVPPIEVTIVNPVTDPVKVVDTSKTKA